MSFLRPLQPCARSPGSKVQATGPSEKQADRTAISLTRGSSDTPGLEGAGRWRTAGWAEGPHSLPCRHLKHVGCVQRGRGGPMPALLYKGWDLKVPHGCKRVLQRGLMVRMTGLNLEGDSLYSAKGIPAISCPGSLGMCANLEMTNCHLNMTQPRPSNA